MATYRQSNLSGDIMKSSKVSRETVAIHPHIKAFSDTTAEQQIEFLETLDFSGHFCLYPSKEALANIEEKKDYGDES